jgi:hypothetical protein
MLDGLGSHHTDEFLHYRQSNAAISSNNNNDLHRLTLTSPLPLRENRDSRPREATLPFINAAYD